MAPECIDATQPRQQKTWMFAGKGRLLRRAALGLVIFSAVPASGAASSHLDPLAPVLLSLALILAAAKLAGDLASRLGQPSVLGELFVGMLLGNLTLLGFHGLDYLKTD